MNRRRLLAAAAAGTALGLATGCASRSEPMHWYELRTEPPVPWPPAVPPRAGSDAVWEISRRVRLPGALDRDTLQRARGNASLEALTGHRWAAPMRDSVPRLLLHDLALLRGQTRVWAAPAPPGVAVDQRLQLEVLTLQALADGRSLRLQALWWLDPVAVGTPAVAPRPRRIDLEVALSDGSVDALAAAHRLALWRLAEGIAASP